MLSLYNGKYQLVFNERSHRYKVNGEFKPGVTTMLKLLDKGDGLIQWAVNCAVEAMQAGLSPVEAKRAYLQRRDDAGDIGKQVHAWIEAYNGGIEGPVTPEIENPVRAYLDWEQQHGITHLHSERVLYSEQHDYCGTVDDVHTNSAGLRVVNDYKTGKPDFEYDAKTKRYTGNARARIEHFLQDALYDQAIGEEDGLWADRYAVTYVTKTGDLYFFETDQTEQLRKLALLVVETYKALKESNFANQYVRAKV